MAGTAEFSTHCNPDRASRVLLTGSQLVMLLDVTVDCNNLPNVQSTFTHMLQSGLAMDGQCVARVCQGPGRLRPEPCLVVCEWDRPSGHAPPPPPHPLCSDGPCPNASRGRRCSRSTVRHAVVVLAEYSVQGTPSHAHTHTPPEAKTRFVSLKSASNSGPFD